MSEKINKRFNVRVYGILIKNEALLLSDERLGKYQFTKFPGGGLEFGEGPVDCILREMQEEIGLNYSIKSHFYTTDFYQESAFNPEHQIISIYYLLDGPAPTEVLISETVFDFKPAGDDQRFRWVKLIDLNESDVTFPIDKKVIQLLKDLS